jgi:hypothetical protein
MKLFHQGSSSYLEDGTIKKGMMHHLKTRVACIAHWRDMKAVAKAKERDQNYETNKSVLTYKTWETHFPS